MFAISARERDMLEMLRELSAYERDFFTKTLETMYETVSYTHLDVYKRQVILRKG